jgi:CheY-like chemotaxis protein
MIRIFLVYWNQEEGNSRAEILRKAGHTVVFEEFGPSSLHSLRKDPPDLVVIDLSRLPMQGRDIGLAIRKFKATRYVPLVFAGGDAGKVSKVKKSLPDAVFTSWRGIRGAIGRALKNPPADPVVPKSLLDGYSGTPLIKKLGIKPGSALTLINAPRDFEGKLGNLPEGVRIRMRKHAGSDLVIWFVRSVDAVSEGLDGAIDGMAGGGGLWIAWPKKSSGIESDLSQAVVRKIGLAGGLVDYKVCSMDETWSALKFARRKGLGDAT